ncbi:MAG TPA: hypothetical protein VKB09_04350 [Thermomicrobiales bacterium]|nr:hypothetical protein [Thermomicrobiales bacterium]
MQTVLFVSTMTLGDEVTVREIHDGFPIDALDQTEGVNRVVAFIGSGFYALELTIDDKGRDFQTRYHKLIGNPEIQRFFNELRAHIDELPAPQDETGHLHFATPLFHWERKT